MSYRRFEVLVLLVGAATVIGGIFFSFGGEIVTEEIVAQLLLLGVLFVALHWGRPGGFISALIATLIYLGLRIPVIVEQ